MSSNLPNRTPTPSGSGIESSSFSASSSSVPNATPQGRKKKVLPNATPEHPSQEQQSSVSESTSSDRVSLASSTPFSSSSASLADKEEYHVDNPIKGQFLTFLQQLRNSDDPLTDLCKWHEKPMLMSKTTEYARDVIFTFPDKIEPIFEDTEILVTEAEQARVNPARVTIQPDTSGGQGEDVGGGQTFGDEGGEGDQGDIQEIREEPRAPQARSAKDRENQETMQFLWYAFQHFLNLDSAKAKDSVESFALLDRIEQLSKKGLRTPSLKAQYEALMLLPVFMVQRF